MQTINTESGYRLIADTFKEMVGYVKDKETGNLEEVARVKEVDVISGTEIKWVEEIEKVINIL